MLRQMKHGRAVDEERRAPFAEIHTGATADVAQECEAARMAVPIVRAAIARPSGTAASVPLKPPVVKPLSPEHYTTRQRQSHATTIVRGAVHRVTFRRASGGRCGTATKAGARSAELFFGPLLAREERAIYSGKELGPERVADLPHSRNPGWR
jgi:hypothetical protein